MKKIIFDRDGTVGLGKKHMDDVRCLEEMYGDWLDFQVNP